MAADPTELLDALVDNATRHGGDITAILDAQARFKGEPTSAELAEEAEAEATEASESGKAANAKQVEDEKEAATKPASKTGDK